MGGGKTLARLACLSTVTNSGPFKEPVNKHRIYPYQISLGSYISP
jgi:hypothetical protein